MRLAAAAAVAATCARSVSLSRRGRGCDADVADADVADADAADAKDDCVPAGCGGSWLGRRL
jgi:hypothetical protein